MTLEEGSPVSPKTETVHNKVASFLKNVGAKYERHLVNARHRSTKRFISEYVRKVKGRDQDMDQLMGNASSENESLLLPANEYLEAEFFSFLDRMGKSENQEGQLKRLEQMRSYSCTAVRELRRYAKSDPENQAQLLYAARRIILKAVEVTGRYDHEVIDRGWLNSFTRNVLNLGEQNQLDEQLALFSKNPPKETVE